MSKKYRLSVALDIDDLLMECTSYAIALEEVRNGSKASHWMWYIFPQLRGLGQSNTAWYYGIGDLNEAKAYLNKDSVKVDVVEERLVSTHTTKTRIESSSSGGSSTHSGSSGISHGGGGHGF